VGEAGDVNGDGYDDFFLASGPFSVGFSGTGQTLIFHGSSNGPAAFPDTVLSATHTGAARYPRASAAIGDINLDGFDDFAISDDLVTNTCCTGKFAGVVFVHYGSSNGLSATPSWEHWDVENNESASFGADLSGADINGDGYADLIVAHSKETENGTVEVFPGGSGGLTTNRITISPTEIDLLYEGVGFADSVTGLRDIDGDGCDEVVVGSPYEGSYFDLTNYLPVINQGVVSVHRYATNTGLFNLIWHRAGPSNDYRLGQIVCDAGDVNGDGADDLIAMAGYSDNYRADLFTVTNGNFTAASTWSADTIHDNWNTALNKPIAGVGDLNGDGYDDIALGMSADPAHGEPFLNQAYVFSAVLTNLSPLGQL